jgi:cation transporter-like permease
VGRVSTNKEKAEKGLVIGAWFFLVFSIIGWPLTAMTIFSKEPPGILGLSWLAIIIECLVLLVQAYIKQDQQ